MANTLAIYQAEPFAPCTVMTSASGTAEQTLVTATADGMLIDNIAVTSSDTGSIILVVKINDGTTICQVGEVTVAAGVGTNGTLPAINLLDAVALPFLQTDGSLPIGALGSLIVNAKVSISAGAVHLVTFGGQYV